MATQNMTLANDLRPEYRFWAGHAHILFPIMVFLIALLPGIDLARMSDGDATDYIVAAQCLSEHGYCIAETHWAARWPLLAPLAAAFAMGGDVHWSSALVQALYTLATIWVFCLLTGRLFGNRVALYAGLAFASFPALLYRSGNPGVDIPELFWLLVGAYFIVKAGWGAKQQRWLLIASGAALGIAIMTRMTAAVSIAAIGAAMLYYRYPWKNMVWIALGGLAALIPDILVSAWTTGDPLHSYVLMVNHSKIPTTELPTWVDISKSPFFNLDLIANWRRTVSVHWTVDPLINQYAHPESGLALVLMTGVILLGRKGFSGSVLAKKWFIPAAIGCAAIFLCLCFVLSVHFNPRMFFPIYAVVFMAAGWAAVHADGASRITLLISIPILLFASFGPNNRPGDARYAIANAERFVSEASGPVTSSKRAHRTLIASPVIAALPMVEDMDDQRQRLVISANECTEDPLVYFRGWRIVRQAGVRDPDSWRGKLWGQRVQERWNVCLIAPAAPN